MSVNIDSSEAVDPDVPRGGASASQPTGAIVRTDAAERQSSASGGLSANGVAPWIPL